MENINEEKEKNPTKKDNKKKKELSKKKSRINAERDKYFGFYDDIKSGCQKIVDW